MEKNTMSEVTEVTYSLRFLKGQDDPEVLDSIRKFYSDVQYPHEVSGQDGFVLMLKGCMIVGVVRLCKEYDLQILRGMEVHPLYQQKGLGTRMLYWAFRYMEPVCFCLPYAHLLDFYSKIGFKGANEMKIPMFLQERLEQYRQENPDKQYIAMVRRG